MNELSQAARTLSDKLRGLTFSGEVTHVYDPLTYAWEPHQNYLETYGSGRKKVLFLGMNPGPWGMAQVGVPFGEISLVRDWMKISGTVKKPEREHPKRPIEGFACARSEVSGKRLWGLFSERFPEAGDFFKNHLVMNFCPLVWMGETGKNITPDKITAEEMRPVYAACREHLRRTIEVVEPDYLIGVGAFAEKQLASVKKEFFGDLEILVGKVLHPSPASPLANRGWGEQAERQLEEMGISLRAS